MLTGLVTERHDWTCLTLKLSDAAPVALQLAAESARQAAAVTPVRRSLERNVRHDDFPGAPAKVKTKSLKNLAD